MLYNALCSRAIFYYCIGRAPHLRFLLLVYLLMPSTRNWKSCGTFVDEGLYRQRTKRTYIVNIGESASKSICNSGGVHPRESQRPAQCTRPRTAYANLEPYGFNDPSSSRPSAEAPTKYIAYCSMHTQTEHSLSINISFSDQVFLYRYYRLSNRHLAWQSVIVSLNCLVQE